MWPSGYIFNIFLRILLSLEIFWMSAIWLVMSKTKNLQRRCSYYSFVVFVYCTHVSDHYYLITPFCARNWCQLSPQNKKSMFCKASGPPQWHTNPTEIWEWLWTSSERQCDTLGKSLMCSFLISSLYSGSQPPPLASLEVCSHRLLIFSLQRTSDIEA